MSTFNRSANGNFHKDGSIYTLFHGAKTILLEDELNELQWNQIERLASMNRGQYTNGMMTSFTIKTTNYDDIFYIEADTPFSVLLDGYDLKMGNNTISGQPSDIVSADNRLIFKLPHYTSGTDLVFIEAWFEVMKYDETLRKFGGIDTPIITNKMYDDRVQRETSRRVQFRWRIRVERNVSSLSSVNALNYNGSTTSVKFVEKDGIYVANLGEQRTADGDLKTLGTVYALPLFMVNRNGGYKIALNQIIDMTPKARLRLLDDYDISKIAHAKNYIKLLKVESKGLSSTIGDRGIWIDGQLVLYTGRSYGLVVIKRSTGEVVFTGTYDVYGNPAKAQELADKLATYDRNYIVVINTYDEPKDNRKNQALINQIKRCGGSSLFESDNIKFRGAYLLIGIPDSGEGKGIEEYAGNIDSDPSAYVYKTTFIVDGDVIAGGGSSSSGTAIDKQFALTSMSAVENTAEILRGLGASGLYAVRQYGLEDPFDETSKVYTVSFNTIGEHNHPNYRGMPGTPELAFIINGYYLRTRHNDYRTFKPVYKPDPASGKGVYLYREEEMPPAVPNHIKNADLATQYEFMKNVHTKYPEYCEWHLAYIEVWWEKLTPDIVDYVDSFRHALNQENIYSLFSDANFWSISGLKNLNENVAFFPIVAMDFDSNGKPIYLILRYRINTKKVSTLKDTPFNRQKAIDGIIDSTNRFTLVRDLQAMKRYGYGNDWGKLIDSGRARFKCADLDKFMRMCPGIEGEGPWLPDQNKYDDSVGAGAIVETVNRNDNTYTTYERDNSGVLKAGYYNHDFLVRIKDAAGRNTGERDYNDPNLYVAKTTWTETVHLGYSYALPLELLLRTPRESWNPYNIPDKGYDALRAEQNAGKGYTYDNPFTGYHHNEWNFTIPADLYTTIVDPTKDPADTYNTAYIKCPDGVTRKFMASGIKIFDYDGQRMRFPVYPEFHEATKGYVEAQFVKQRVKDALLKLFKGTITEQEIKDLF